MRPLRHVAGALAAFALFALAPAGASADVTFAGPSFSGASAPTGQKPQSKLWYQDGRWWGVLFNPATADFEIHRLDGDRWQSTGTLVDERSRASADVLWDGSRLYVASGGPTSTNANHAVRVSRFRYDAGSRTWARDVAPVSLTGGGVEAVVLDKDTTGRIWVTYTSGQRVFVAHTTTGDGTWAPPYVLPVGGASTLTSDDISALVAYDGKIGVLWSNQAEDTVYFASHRDGEGDLSWSVERALSGPKYADDHLNVKSLEADPSGRVFAAVKTSVNDVAQTPASARLRSCSSSTVRAPGSATRSARWATTTPGRSCCCTRAGGACTCSPRLRAVAAARSTLRARRSTRSPSRRGSARRSCAAIPT